MPAFEEKAKEYGVADEGYSTQAAFFEIVADRKNRNTFLL